MSLTVCTTATSTAGISTTSRLREHLGTTATSDDDYQARLLVRATDWAERVVGYPLRGPQVYRETLAGYGGLGLMLSRTPIRHVFGVFDATDTGSATVLTSSEYRIEDDEAGVLTRDSGFSWTVQQMTALDPYPQMHTERRPWLIEYSAGWIGPGGKEASSTGDGTTDTGPTIPTDIEQAVIERAAEWYEGQVGVASKKVGDLAITYRSESGDGMTARALLAPYVRRA